MKIGLFGGTFDPVHWGHLRSAEEVRESVGLDRVYFIPASIPPHKRGQITTPAHHRLEMVRLAAAGNAAFAVSRIEVDRPGFSYTLDTLRAFARDLGPGDTLYFIIGMDAFREIATWKDYPELFPLADFVVTSRPGSTENDALRGAGVAVKKLFCYDQSTMTYRHASGHCVKFVKLTDIAISASEIRRRVAVGKSIRYLLPEPVEAYILEHGLYRDGTGERL